MLNQKRNCIAKARTEKIVLVRTWLRLQQVLVDNPWMTGLKPWIAVMIKEVVLPVSDGATAMVCKDAD